MNESIGQIIRRLRKERNLTQEELAEQLNVTSQAVSRWENETGMPDISQVVPLARVFDVSTDVLFGVCGMNAAKEKEKILDEYDQISSPLESYTFMMKALEEYPGDTVFLCHALRDGATVIYCKLTDDISNIVTECERLSRILINCSNDPEAITCAHKELATIYNSLGQYEKAMEHSSKLPDTIMLQTQSIREYHYLNGDFNNTITLDSTMFFRFLRGEFTQAVMNIGKAYYQNEQYENAETCLKSLLGMVTGLFGELPSFLPLEDPIILLAKTYIKKEQLTQALDTLELLSILAKQQKQIHIGSEISTHPLIKPLECKYMPRYDKESLRKDCLDVLSNSIFDTIRNETRFMSIVKSLEE